MNRLTFDGNFCEIAQCRELPCTHGGSCTQRKVWEKLKAYEDLGLEPEDYKRLKYRHYCPRGGYCAWRAGRTIVRCGEAWEGRALDGAAGRRKKQCLNTNSNRARFAVVKQSFLLKPVYVAESRVGIFSASTARYVISQHRKQIMPSSLSLMTAAKLK